jgi:hypothetical protein
VHQKPRGREHCRSKISCHLPRARGISLSLTASAAYRSASAMSSCCKSRYARNISLKLIPFATMSTTVATGILRPRKHGTPPIWLGLTVIRSNLISLLAWLRCSIQKANLTIHTISQLKSQFHFPVSLCDVCVPSLGPSKKFTSATLFGVWRNDWPGMSSHTQVDKLSRPQTSPYRRIKGLGTSAAVDSQTDLTCIYSLIISWPFSRPRPLRL